jgi:signal transduction histidine kinase
LKVITKTAMQHYSGPSLKTRLYLLVLAAFIPVAVMVFYLAQEYKTIEKDAILQRAMALARAVATEENQQLESTRDLLTALSAASLDSRNRQERLSVLFSDLLRQSAAYVDFGVIGPDGRLLAGADPSLIGRDFSDRSWFSACLERKKLTIGQYHGEHVHDAPVLYVALPAIGSRREIASVAFAVLNLNWMNRTVLKQLHELPGGSRLSMLDETQGMLRYDVDAGRWSVPENFDPELRQHISELQSGVLSALDESSVPRIYAFAPLTSVLRSRQISIVLEIPELVALKESKRIFNRNIVLLLVSALIAVLSIWWAADRFILRRVRVMVKVSRELAAGDLKTRIGKIGASDELSHLAEVFDEMAAALQTRIEREQQVTASLEHSREQLRRLSAYQNDVREQERMRIALEIHDQLGQSLTILKMDLSWLKKHLPETVAVVNEKIGTMQQVIEGALNDLHEVTAELRPVILDDFGLAAAIEWQADTFTRRSGIQCRFENRGFEPELPKDQAIALFRIFQETLTNIMRHSGADEVVVRLEKRDGELFFQVADNGRGITEAEINAPDSFGLLGIRERLYPFNGKVTFEANPGRGTLVTIRLPIPSEGEEL